MMGTLGLGVVCGDASCSYVVILLLHTPCFLHRYRIFDLFSSDPHHKMLTPTIDHSNRTFSGQFRHLSPSSGYAFVRKYMSGHFQWLTAKCSETSFVETVLFQRLFCCVLFCFSTPHIL